MTEVPLEPIMEAGNPPAQKSWPYVTTALGVPLVTIVGAVLVMVLHPGDNATLVTQIFGFGVTITVAMLAYLKSSDTREIVNSRMDEFKRTMQLSANAAVLRAHAEGRTEGRASADERTDALASKTEQVHTSVAGISELLKTHDQWERDRLAQPSGTARRAGDPPPTIEAPVLVIAPKKEP